MAAKVFKYVVKRGQTVLAETTTLAEANAIAVKEKGAVFQLAPVKKARKAKVAAPAKTRNPMDITPKDKAVLRAFLDRKPADSSHLGTDGASLEGYWMGGKGIAVWRGDRIETPDLGGKTAQRVQKALRRLAPASWFVTKNPSIKAPAARKPRVAATKRKPKPKPAASRKPRASKPKAAAKPKAAPKPKKAAAKKSSKPRAAVKPGGFGKKKPAIKFV